VFNPVFLVHPLVHLLPRPLPDCLQPPCVTDPKAPLFLDPRPIDLSLQSPLQSPLSTPLLGHDLLDHLGEVVDVLLLGVLPAHDLHPLAHLPRHEVAALEQLAPLGVGQLGVHGFGVLAEGQEVQFLQQRPVPFFVAGQAQEAA